MGKTDNGIAWPLQGKISPETLLRRAREAADRAYAPYSRFHVGSALLFKDEEILTGCNVENASYGLTMCAERGSVFVMASSGKRNPLAIAVAGSYEDRDDYLEIPCPPCGACRQVLMEFNPDMLVVLASADGPKVFELKELLPCSFDLNR